jgi:hypothetical protein
MHSFGTTGIFPCSESLLQGVRILDLFLPHTADQWQTRDVNQSTLVVASVHSYCPFRGVIFSQFLITFPNQSLQLYTGVGTIPRRHDGEAEWASFRCL